MGFDDVAVSPTTSLRQGGHGLANLKEHLGLEFCHHDAGEDVRASASVVLEFPRFDGRLWA
jgi:hypothetical protein